MSIISIQNYFTNGVKIATDHINQNFQSVVNGLQDSSKDLKVSKMETDTISCSSLVSREAASINNLSLTSSQNTVKNLIQAYRTNCKTLSIGNSGYAYTLNATKTLRPGSYNKINLRPYEYNGGSLNSITLDTDKKFKMLLGGSVRTITIPAGTYTGAQMATEIKDQIFATTMTNFTVTYDGLFHISYYVTWKLIRHNFGSNAVTRNSLLPYLGLKWYDTESPIINSVDSDVAYQLHYYNEITALNITDLNDSQILCLGLDYYENSGNSAPVIVYLYGGNIDYDLTLWNRLFLIVRKNEIGSSECIQIFTG